MMRLFNIFFWNTDLRNLYNPKNLLLLFTDGLAPIVMESPEREKVVFLGLKKRLKEAGLRL